MTLEGRVVVEEFDCEALKGGELRRMLKLKPVPDGGGTFAEWWAEFDCAPEREGELAHTIGQGVFLAAQRAGPARGLPAASPRDAGRRHRLTRIGWTPA